MKQTKVDFDNTLADAGHVKRVLEYYRKVAKAQDMIGRDYASSKIKISKKSIWKLKISAGSHMMYGYDKLGKRTFPASKLMISPDEKNWAVDILKAFKKGLRDIHVQILDDIDEIASILPIYEDSECEF